MGETVLVLIDGSPLSHQALRHALEKFPDAEIIKNKENTRAFRRGMNPTTHSTIHRR